MNPLKEYLRRSPVHARFLPFALFIAPLLIQDQLGESMRYWIYLFRTIIGAWCVWEMRTLVPEMRWKFSWEGLVAGVLALAIWVGLDPYYPPNNIIFKQGAPWNPFKEFGGEPVLAWFFFLVRTVGTTVVVPPLEEVFYRSFLYRYLVKTNFEEMPFNRIHWLSFFVTSLFFGLQHFQWLAGILVGVLFQLLVIRKNRLGDSMFAHAVTNFLLSFWVLRKSAWSFW
jgi:CAAX prenyl protease-like protein